MRLPCWYGDARNLADVDRASLEQGDDAKERNSIIEYIFPMSTFMTASPRIAMVRIWESDDLRIQFVYRGDPGAGAWHIQASHSPVAEDETVIQKLRQYSPDGFVSMQAAYQALCEYYQPAVGGSNSSFSQQASGANITPLAPNPARHRVMFAWQCVDIPYFLCRSKKTGWYTQATLQAPHAERRAHQDMFFGVTFKNRSRCLEELAAWRLVYTAAI